MGLLSLLKRGTRWDSLANVPPIRTPRLLLAPLTPDEAEAVRRLTDDPAVTGAVDFLPNPFTLEDARRLTRASGKGRDVFLGVRTQETGLLVGVVGTHLRALEAIEIGYWIGGASRGRGYGSEAIGGLVHALARRFTRRAIIAECRPENVASWEMLHKVGFRPTGDVGHRPGRKVLVWDVRQIGESRTVRARASDTAPAGGLDWR